MTQSTEPQGDTPEKTSGAAPAAATTAASSAAVPTAWYARPALWSLLLLLLLALYGGWLVWLQWQAANTFRAAQALALERQVERNTLLETQKARLTEAQNADPCVARDILGHMPPLPAAGQEPATTSTPRADGRPGAAAGASETPQAAPGVEKPGAENARPATEKDTPVTPQGAPAPMPKTMAELLEQATVLVLSETSKGLQMGTGFYIAPGTILTNQHVVGNGKGSIYVVGKAVGVLKAQTRHISTASGRDYAVLTVPVTPVKALAFSTDVARTQRVSAWGFPGAITGDDPKFQALLQGKSAEAPEVVYSEGAVSVILDRKPPLIVHTAVVSQGNSGGPLVNEKGDVVGINTYIRLDDESYRQSSLALVSKDVLDYLKGNNIPFTLAGAKE